MLYTKDELETIISNFNPDLKLTSLKAYTRTLIKLQETVGDLHEVKEKDIDKFTRNVSTKKNYITAYIIFLRALKVEGLKITEYEDIHKTLSIEQEEGYLDNVKSDKDKDNWLDMEGIIAKREQLISSEGLAYQNYLILSLYTLLPPLRNDYANILIRENMKGNCDDIEDKTHNYISIKTSQLLLCDYKTSKHYGVKSIDIPQELMKIITQWITIKKGLNIKNDYLLINSKLEKMSKNNLTKVINKIFHPKKISTTLLRKIYLSHKYPVTNTFREMQNDSYVMGHSIETARKVYAKL